LLVAGVLAALWWLVTWLTGGFTFRVGGLAVTSHDLWRPLSAAALLLVLARVGLGREEFRRSVRPWTGAGDRVAGRIAVLAAVAVAVTATAWNTRASGGSDSSCYLLQAKAFIHGQALLRDPLAASAPFPDAGRLFAPTGWTQAPSDPRAAAPICAPGLALLMAGPLALGGPGAATLVVPLLAGLAVWLTFLFGRRVGGSLTGAASAVLIACSPIFLFQAMQPMSDVPSVTLWLGAIVGSARRDRAGDLAAGFCAGLAVLTRPNLAVAIAPIGLWIAVDPASPWRTRLMRLLRFGIAAGAPLGALGFLNAWRYGSPLASGYGEAGALFSMDHVWPNLQRYPRWLLETHTPFLLLALVAPVVLWRDRDARAIAVVSLTAAAFVFITYLAYVVFNDWWYIRFLLPALPTLVVLSVAVAVKALGSVPTRVARPVAALSIAALAGWFLHVAEMRQVFELQAIEARFLRTGDYAARTLRPDAVVLSAQQSGSIRYHGGRSTLTWDAIDRDALDATLAWLDRSGRPSFVALEDAEEPRFRQRFAGQRYGALDWPPQAEIHGRVRVRIYAVADRARFLRGATIETDHRW
jgi:hypothetical protein